MKIVSDHLIIMSPAPGNSEYGNAAHNPAFFWSPNEMTCMFLLLLTNTLTVHCTTVHCTPEDWVKILPETTAQ